MQKISKDNIKDVYPLSPMQEGMLFQALYEPESDAYFEQISYRIAGPLDVGVFRQGWNGLANRHDVLRTVFVHEKTERPLQIVLKHAEVEFSFEDIRDKSRDRQEAFLEEYRLNERKRRFHIGRDALTRVAVFALGDASYEVVWSFHHILMDGWSAGILLGELVRIYHSLLNGSQPNLPGRASYGKYIEWLEKQDKEVSRRYWERYLSGYEGIASVPFLRPSAEAMGYTPAELKCVFDREKTERLRLLAAENQVTLNTVVQAIWGVLLGRYNGRDDVVFGAVVSGRPAQIHGVEEMVGLFMNTIPVRVRMEAGDSFTTLLHRAQKASLDGQDHQHLALAETQRKRGMLDHILVFESYPLDRQLQSSMQSGIGGLRIERVTPFEQTPYHLNVVFDPSERLETSFRFNERVYGHEQMERVAGHFRMVVDSVLENGDIPVDEIEILPPAERRQLTHVWNDTAVAFPGDKTIVGLFDEQARKLPERTAIVFQDARVSYRELDERSSRLANVLRERCRVKGEDRVAVALDRSEMLPICFLGVLKSGAAYIPIDPSYPPERVKYMLSDSGAVAVLSEGKHVSLLAAATDREILDVRKLPDYTGKDRTGDNADAGPERLAYVIYTSGSTGTPKGVMVVHRGIVNLMGHQKRLLRIQEGDRVAQFASPSFDASVWEMCVALLHGGSLVVADRDTVADPARFGRFLREHRVSLALLPPSYLKTLDPEDVSVLKTLVTGGEAAQREDALSFSRRLRYVNAYGPTETSIIAACHEVDPAREYPGAIPVGAPVNNTVVYVLDSKERLSPIGVPGEIYIGGAGLARGYLKRPELTREKFVENPFGVDSGPLLYRTGDRGRWLPDGNIEFLGRVDRQVKVRGFRIEPGEIESVLMSHPAVRNAVVTTGEDRPDGAPVSSEKDTRLTAYIVFDTTHGGQAPPTGQLRDFLSGRLPDYMIPSFFVALKAIPLTANGKVDYRALLAPEVSGGDSREGYVAPRTPTEESLAEIWTKVLEVDRVGVHDNFFELGGHSLTATRVISQVRNKFKVELPIAALFESPSIAGLSSAIELAASSNIAPQTPAIERIPRRARPQT